MKLLIGKLISHEYIKQNKDVVTEKMPQVKSHEFKQIRVRGLNIINWKMNEPHKAV